MRRLPYRKTAVNPETGESLKMLSGIQFLDDLVYESHLEDTPGRHSPVKHARSCLGSAGGLHYPFVTRWI